MNLLFIGKIGGVQFKTCDILPRVGDKVDLFYRPYPTVSNVLLYPSLDTLDEMGLNQHVDAVITLE